MSKMSASYLQNYMRTLLCFSLLSLFFFMDEGYTQRVQYKSESHHTFQVNYLLPSPSCTPSAIGGTRKSSLEVVHKRGPCSQHAAGAQPKALNHTKILAGDQSRVDSIRSKITTSFGGSKAALPATLGIPFDSVEYVVTVSIGSTVSNLTLVFDTGSDLTWTQCEPCSSCYPQSQPIFDPSRSSSYANIPCSSPVCSSATCSGSACFYQIRYVDNSFTSGNLATDTLTLTTTDVISNFQFGCGESNHGSFGEVAGLLGLARGSLSIVEQTASKYGQYFSYCLPSLSSSSGYLAFGNTIESSKSLTFTPMATIPGSPSFYGINIVGIAVGGAELQIPSTVFTNTKAIIDSGTVITRLPSTAYNALRTAFQKDMASYKRAESAGFLDTCYDLRNTHSVIIPKIKFSFSGGAFMDLDPNGILFTISDSQVCLAFAANSDDTELVIYGNVQQRNFEVIYDVAGGQLGFAPNGCP